MTESIWMLYPFAALAALTGFAWLALAMDAHWHQVHGGTRPTARVRNSLRLFGLAALITSGVLCFSADRPSMAVLVWLMLLVSSVPLIGLTLASRPRLLRLLWPWGDRTQPHTHA